MLMFLKSVAVAKRSGNDMKLKNFLLDERGDFVQYALYLIIIVLGLAPFLSALTVAVGNKFTQFTEKVNEIGG